VGFSDVKIATEAPGYLIVVGISNKLMCSNMEGTSILSISFSNYYM
jgi:hypothetical protein